MPFCFGKGEGKRNHFKLPEHLVSPNKWCPLEKLVNKSWSPIRAQEQGNVLPPPSTPPPHQLALASHHREKRKYATAPHFDHAVASKEVGGNLRNTCEIQSKGTGSLKRLSLNNRTKECLPSPKPYPHRTKSLLTAVPYIPSIDVATCQPKVTRWPDFIKIKIFY